MRPSFVAAQRGTQTPPYPLSHLLSIHTHTLSLCVAHFTLHSSRHSHPQRREYTSSSTKHSDPLPLPLLLPAVLDPVSSLLPHLPFPGSTKHDLMI
jgi:hypothetical protein